MATWPKSACRLRGWELSGRVWPSPFSARTARMYPGSFFSESPLHALVAGAVCLDQHGRIEFSATWKFLGDASYSIYLIHLTAIIVVAKIWTMADLPTEGLAQRTHIHVHRHGHRDAVRHRQLFVSRKADAQFLPPPSRSTSAQSAAGHGIPGRRLGVRLGPTRCPRIATSSQRKVRFRGHGLHRSLASENVGTPCADHGRCQAGRCFNSFEISGFTPAYYSPRPIVIFCCRGRIGRQISVT